MDKTIKTLTEAIQLSKEGTKPYDAVAEVVRVEGDTAWCHIVGGIDETPVKMTIAAQEGDTVQVRVSGGRAWITGNQSAPPTDDTIANVANKSAKEAKKTADEAHVTAENAEEVANKANEAARNVNQYFWHTETDTGAGAGAHITEVPKDEFLDDPDNGGGNLLAQSGGITIRKGLQKLGSFTAGSRDQAILSLTDTDLCRIWGEKGSSGNTIIDIQTKSEDGRAQTYITSGSPNVDGGTTGVNILLQDNHPNGSTRFSVVAEKSEFTGDVYVNNHSTPIGYNNTGSGTRNSFPSNSQTQLVGGISVSEGTWLLICRAGFPANATGRRFACWHNNTTGEDYYSSYSSSAAVSGGYTNVQTVMTIKLTEATTLSVHAFQNSGSAMNVAYNWTITRIA